MSRTRTRAFTLIELLVVIAIIGVLMSILLPSLGKSRQTARDTVGKSNLRSAGTLMLAYLNDSGERFLNPFLPVPQSRPWTSVPDHDGVGYWDFNSNFVEFRTELFAQYWYSYLSEWRGSPPVGDEMYSPADAEQMTIVNTVRTNAGICNECILWPTSYLYSPVFWMSKARYGSHGEMIPQAFAMNSAGAVTSPSAKVLLWERADFGQQINGGSPGWNTARARTDVFTVDGSMSEIVIADLMQTIRDGAADLLPVENFALGPGIPLEQGTASSENRTWPDVAPPAFFWATTNGVGGRDFNR